MHGVFGQGRLRQFQRMIDQALAGETVTATRGAGAEYARLDDVLGAPLMREGRAVVILALFLGATLLELTTKGTTVGF